MTTLKGISALRRPTFNFAGFCLATLVMALMISCTMEAPIAGLLGGDGAISDAGFCGSANVVCDHGTICQNNMCIAGNADASVSDAGSTNCGGVCGSGTVCDVPNNRCVNGNADAGSTQNCGGTCGNGTVCNVQNNRCELVANPDGGVLPDGGAQASCSIAGSVTVRVLCASNNCQSFIYHGGATRDNGTDDGYFQSPMSGNRDWTFTLTRCEACNRPEGVEIKPRVASDVNPLMPWYACPDTPTAPTDYSSVSVFVNGSQVQFTTVVRAAACGGKPPGNILLSLGQLGC